MSCPNFPQVGTYGFIVVNSHSNTVLESYNSHDRFPLASVAKLFIGAIVAEAIQDGELSWDTKLSNVQFDPKEDSRSLYPHLQSESTLFLRDVTEVMIACHDHFCANKLAELFGCWEVLAQKVSISYPNTQINQNPRDVEKNSAILGDVIKLLRNISMGYQNRPDVWEPILHGLLKQQDQIETLPKEHVYNLTGGLPHAFIDAGILRGCADHRQLLYVVAGKELPDRQFFQEGDVAAADLIQGLYDCME